MAETLYGRRCRVLIETPVNFVTTGPNVFEINGGDSLGMRVQFKIKKTSEKEPNCSEITITNLSEHTRQSLQTKGVKVTLEAGYVATGITRIFRGDARFIDHVREGADWETKFKCGDGERSYRYARLTESFSDGVTAGDIVAKLVTASGLQLGNDPYSSAILSAKRFDHGYSVDGTVANSLERLLKSIGLQWSIQNETISILDPGQPVPLEVVPEISPETGLIGSPEMGTPEHTKKPALLKFKSLLLPVRPGRKVKLLSERYKGFVKLIKVELIGDTHGGEWFSEMHGVIVGQ